MKNFLSIGDVSKIKGVSHRMLRYYDQLGILTPAYTNQDTGYRYYSTSQMTILDFILICTDLGIPLKEMKHYILETDTYHIQHLIEDGQKLATLKLKELNDTLYKLHTIKEHFNNHTSCPKGTYNKFFGERYFFVETFDFDTYDITSYWRSISQLSKRAKERHLSLSINKGQCFINKAHDYSSFIYVEVSKPLHKSSDILIIPSGVYQCEYFEDDDASLFREKYNQDYPSGTILIAQDVIEKYIRPKVLPFEVQLLIGL